MIFTFAGKYSVCAASVLTAALFLSLPAVAETAGTATPASTGTASGKPGTGSMMSQTSASDAATPEHHEIAREPWTYSGLTGYFDQQQLRRGYKVYKQVCTNCHNMRLMYFRNLGQPGGPEFPKETVEAIAAEAQIPDPTVADGQTRPGKPADAFQWVFKNEQEARATLNGALPPDLSLMTKARTVERETPWYAFPFVMVKDIATQYQEQGSDYVHALLTSYSEPPAGRKIADGMYYNATYPGNQIAMPPPLQDGTVDYEDGTPNTLDQQARDVTAYLAWAAEPRFIERKKLGLWVLGYLGVLVGLLFVSKNTLWRNIRH